MPQQNHDISLEVAVTMTTDYRANMDTILKDEYQNQGILAVCETFDKGIFQAFIDNPECQRVRIYYGMDDNLKVHAIIVGVNPDGEDMIPTSDADVPLYENAERCPPNCPPASVLNS